MALNFPSAPQVDDTYTDQNGRLWLYDGVKWEVSRGSSNKLFSGAKARLDTFYSLTSTPTALDYDSEEFDIDNYFTLTQASRLTVSRDGYYRISGTLFTGSLGTGSSYTFSLVKNGTITLQTVTVAANQAANYDAIIQLSGTDYVQVFVSEADSIGTLLAGSYVEITRVGLTAGTAIGSANAFSGVRARLTSPYTMASTPLSIVWNAYDYDTNANEQGETYWNAATPTRLVIKKTGYYNVKSFIYTSTDGAANSYVITLRKNAGTTLATINLSANDFASIDEIMYLQQNDYLQILAYNTGSVGQITTDTYLEITRLGV